MKRDVLDAKVVRGMFNGSKHFVVVEKVRTREKWEVERKGKKEVVKKE